MRKMIAGVGFALATLASPAIGDDHSTFQSLWAEATANPICKPADYADYILVTCDSSESTQWWYFTKANHPAHPSVIKRMLQRAKDGSWTTHEEGQSFARNSAQPAFQAWFARIENLDRQTGDMSKPQTGAGVPKSN